MSQYETEALYFNRSYSSKKSSSCSSSDFFGSPKYAGTRPCAPLSSISSSPIRSTSAACTWYLNMLDFINYNLMNCLCLPQTYELQYHHHLYFSRKFGLSKMNTRDSSLAALFEFLFPNPNQKSKPQTPHNQNLFKKVKPQTPKKF